jgi:hypothetical protein
VVAQAVVLQLLTAVVPVVVEASLILVVLLVLEILHQHPQAKVIAAVLVALICLVEVAVLVLPELLAVVLEQVVTVETALLQAFRAAQ